MRDRPTRAAHVGADAMGYEIGVGENSIGARLGAHYRDSHRVLLPSTADVTIFGERLPGKDSSTSLTSRQRSLPASVRVPLHVCCDPIVAALAGAITRGRAARVTNLVRNSRITLAIPASNTAELALGSARGAHRMTARRGYKTHACRLSRRRFRVDFGFAAVLSKAAFGSGYRPFMSRRRIYTADEHLRGASLTAATVKNMGT